ncbi:MAG: hypothetical protein ACRD6X_21350 [Pyrinomonadaceae bacterium]
MTSTSRIEKAFFQSIAYTVLAAGCIEVAVYIGRESLRRPPAPHEYQIDPVIFHFRVAAWAIILSAVILFSYGRAWLTLSVCPLPILLFTRWLYVFYERWQSALNMNLDLGSDDGLSRNNFLAFFIARGGLDPWDVLALIAVIALAALQIKILLPRSTIEK